MIVFQVIFWQKQFYTCKTSLKYQCSLIIKTDLYLNAAVKSIRPPQRSSSSSSSELPGPERSALPFLELRDQIILSRLCSFSMQFCTSAYSCRTQSLGVSFSCASLLGDTFATIPLILSTSCSCFTRFSRSFLSCLWSILRRSRALCTFRGSGWGREPARREETSSSRKEEEKEGLHFFFLCLSRQGVDSFDFDLFIAFTNTLTLVVRFFCPLLEFRVLLGVSFGVDRSDITSFFLVGWMNNCTELSWPPCLVFCWRGFFWLTPFE